MNKELTEMIYNDVDSIAQSYISHGMSEQDSYELSYAMAKTGLKPPYEAKRPVTLHVPEYGLITGSSWGVH